jgi:hypothetical protein
LFNVIVLNVELPDTFNDDNIVVLLDNKVKPETFKDDINVVLFNVEYPDTFNDDINVVLFNVEYPDTFKADNNVEFPDTVKLLILNIVRDVKSFIYPNIVVVVLFKLLIDNIDDVDKLFKLFSLLVILKLIPETSTGSGGLPLSPPVKKSFRLVKPRNATIEATPFAAPVATILTASICPSCKRNLAALIIDC